MMCCNVYLPFVDFKIGTSAEVSIEVSCDTSIQSNLTGVTFWKEQLLVAVVFLSDNHTSSE